MKPAVKLGMINALVAVALLLAALIVTFVIRSEAPSSASDGGGDTPALIDDDARVLDDGGPGAVTLVEFLDFECEACGAFSPIVEDLRNRYAGELTYVVRYFPLPSHANSLNAARAAEAAARQGRFEEMYRLLFDTQAQWGEAQESRAALFRGFAAQLGLDMAEYDTAIADPATSEKITQDVKDGQALGVEGTPTFYVEGERLSLRQFDDLEKAIIAARNGK